MKPSFFVTNLTSNTKYLEWVYSKTGFINNLHAPTLSISYKRSNLFNSLSKFLCKQVKSVLIFQHYFLFFWQMFFNFFNSLILLFALVFNFIFCCLVFVWFLLVSIFFSWLCCSFFERSTCNDFRCFHTLICKIN